MVAIDDTHGTFTMRFYVETCWHEPNIEITSELRTYLEENNSYRFKDKDFEELARLAHPAAHRICPHSTADFGLCLLVCSFRHNDTHQAKEGLGLWTPNM